ncbi:Serine/threonine-protein kinase mph1 [Armadillidium vulgare]|nr:Serine/threonine-protein kinase mph1 [Armadillidium vulgare]
MNHSEDDDQNQYSVEDILFTVLNTKKRKTKSKSKEPSDSYSSLKDLEHDSSKNLNFKTVTNSTLFNERSEFQDRYDQHPHQSLILNYSSNYSNTKSNTYRQIFIDDVKDTPSLLQSSPKPLEEVSVVNSERKHDIHSENQPKKSIYSSGSISDLTTFTSTKDVKKNSQDSAICKGLESSDTKLSTGNCLSNKSWTYLSANKNLNSIYNKPHLSSTLQSKLKEIPTSYMSTVNKPVENKDLKSVGANVEKYNKDSDKENIPLSLEKKKLEVKHVFSKPLPRPSSFSLEIGNSDIITVNNQNYLKMGELGKGGSSIVYEVLDMQSKQRKAIKIVTLDKEDEMTRLSYKNEIKILQRLCHSPRIINLFDYEESPSVLKLVMEAGNVDLAGILKTVRENNKPIPAFSIKHYWQEMLLAVQVIHSESIIHSDLKPANFLQVNGTLKLIDFGIASSIQNDMTSVFKDNQCGTFNFMSPESLNDISNGPILGNKQTDKLVIKDFMNTVQVAPWESTDEPKEIFKWIQGLRKPLTNFYYIIMEDLWTIASTRRVCNDSVRALGSFRDEYLLKR